MRVTFWGARGTFPATGAQFARYGGDTMCVAVESGGARLIIDAGSGLRALGARLMEMGEAEDIHILLSHLHLDHIMGLPHFAPFWRRGARVTIHAPAACLVDAEDAAASVLTPPLFPVDLRALPAQIVIKPYALGDLDLPFPELRAHAFALAHQGPSAGFVIESGGAKLVYATDHEHGDEEAEARLAQACEAADMLVYDATFTEAEWRYRRGWGHSTWEAGVRMKRRAGVKLLALAHHEPDRTDDELDALGEAASAVCANVFCARQGLTIAL